ncbi:hypothetical protein [Actinomyces oris]|jgi:hypothetical protein|uniref:Uncharacterized protein n=1 Tax=Actinomyces oris TaxID=544580 RepID=A0AAW8L4R7_9ACTO|nr:hypothetical protein [Actinomyces oris]MDR0177093.1 hypothetical protein [Actinomyces oris]
MKLTTTSSLEHRVRTTQFAVTSAFGGASVNVDLLAPGGSTCSSAGSSSSCSTCAVTAPVR